MTVAHGRSGMFPDLSCSKFVIFACILGVLAPIKVGLLSVPSPLGLNPVESTNRLQYRIVGRFNFSLPQYWFLPRRCHLGLF